MWQKQSKQSKQSKLATIKGILNGTISPKDLLPKQPSWVVKFLDVSTGAVVDIYKDSPFANDDQERELRRKNNELNGITEIDIETLSSTALPEPTPKPELKNTLLSTTLGVEETPGQETKATDKPKRIGRKHSAGRKATEPQPVNGGLLSQYGEPGGWQVIQNFKQKR